MNGTTTDFLYDGLNPVQELSGGNVVANLLTSLGRDEVLSRTEATGSRVFLADGLGSTLALTDSLGTVQTEYTYEPFGNTSATGTPSTNAFQYTGRENDETGLYYYRARYYHSTLQRFISEDPIGFAGKDVNLYAYVFNNPVTFIDPNGLIIVVGGVGGSAIIGVGAEGSVGGYHNTASGETGVFGSVGTGLGINLSGDIFGGLVWGELAGNTTNINLGLGPLSITFLTDPCTGKLIGFTAGLGPGLPLGLSVTDSKTGAW